MFHSKKNDSDSWLDIEPFSVCSIYISSKLGTWEVFFYYGAQNEFSSVLIACRTLSVWAQKFVQALHVISYYVYKCWTILFIWIPWSQCNSSLSQSISYLLYFHAVHFKSKCWISLPSISDNYHFCERYMCFWSSDMFIWRIKLRISLDSYQMWLCVQLCFCLLVPTYHHYIHTCCKTV